MLIMDFRYILRFYSTVKMCPGVFAFLGMCSWTSTQHLFQDWVLHHWESFWVIMDRRHFRKLSLSWTSRDKGRNMESSGRERIMYQSTAWAAVSILTVPRARVHSSPTLSTALRPGWPRRPENRLRAGNLIIAESAKEEQSRLPYLHPKMLITVALYHET